MCSDPTHALTSLTNEAVSDLYRNVIINAQSSARSGAQANETLGKNYFVAFNLKCFCLYEQEADGGSNLTLMQD